MVLIFGLTLLAGCASDSGKDQDFSQQEAIKKICAYSSDVKIWRCDNFYYTYPSGWMSAEERKSGKSPAIVVDSANYIFDNEGNFVRYCGGFISREEADRQANECGKYPRNNCGVALESCFDLE